MTLFPLVLTFHAEALKSIYQLLLMWSLGIEYGHVLFYCPKAQEVWKVAGLWSLIKPWLLDETARSLVGIFGAVSKEILERCCGSIWTDRNRCVHGSPSRPAISLVEFADCFRSKYQSVTMKTPSIHVADVSESTRLQRWKGSTSRCCL
ncbi:hypothetical protein TorRG33x02_334790 [Trema orientale]|uniref:Uncharacterized protein n=1 Tax=Trema orientale TaxID=63057 RepID=A0A2P5B272_TREOI|nr:hypothetical protein TorRG33x02_334790 [Trema orientale]